jgi:broad specificity phosphatase PhoE
MSIYLIRHGETDLNAARVLQMPGTPLSTLGREQAERLAEHLRDAGIVHVLASDYARAEQTARPLERASGATLELEPLLQERNFGDLRGVAYADLSEDPFAPGFAPPGGETEAVFQERVAGAWQRITEVAARVPGHLAVVTHGLVCRGIVRDHLVDPAGVGEPGSPLPVRNTSFSVIDGPDPWRLLKFGLSDHLGELDAPGDAPA